MEQNIELLRKKTVELKELLADETISYNQLHLLRGLVDLLEPIEKIPRTIEKAKLVIEHLTQMCQEDMSKVYSFLESGYGKRPVRIQRILAAATPELIDALQCVYVADLNFDAESTIDQSVLCALYMLLEYGVGATEKWVTFDLQQLCAVADEESRAVEFLYTYLNIENREDRREVVHKFLREIYMLDHGNEIAAASDHTIASVQQEIHDEAQLYFDDMKSILRTFEALVVAGDKLESAAKDSQLVQANPNVRAALLQKACMLAMAESIADSFHLKETRSAFLGFATNMVVQISGNVEAYKVTATTLKPKK